MEVLARLALPGILALSATATLIVGMLLVRYGFAAPEDDAYDAERRIAATRIGHMLVVVCLAGIAVLAAAALMVRPAARAGTPAAGLAPSSPSSPAASPDAPAPGAPGRATASAEGPDGSASRPATENAVSSEHPDSSEPGGKTRSADPAARPDEPARPRQAAAAAPRPGSPAQRPAGSSATRPGGPEPALPRQAAATLALPDSSVPGARGKQATPPREPAARSADATATRSAASRDTAAIPELPPRPRADERPAAMDTRDGGAAPGLADKPQLSTTVHGVRVDVHRQAGDAGEAVYTVRLAAPGDQPLTGADVSLLGRGPDGQPLRATLAPAGEPGYYRGRVATRSTGDLRLRIAHAGTRFEVSLDRAASW